MTSRSAGGHPGPSARVLGLGGSLKPGSSSLSALRLSLEGAATAGAETELVAIGDLDLPFYVPRAQDGDPEAARRLADSAYACDGLILSTPLYHGSISGSFKNAIDWLQLLARREPPYLTDKVVGLIAAAGGTQGLQAINTMEFIVRALRGWAVPLVVPVPRAWQAFDRDGGVHDEGVRDSLQGLGAEVVRASRQVIRSGTCDYADHPRPTIAWTSDVGLSFGPQPGPGDSDGG